MTIPAFPALDVAPRPPVSMQLRQQLRQLDKRTTGIAALLFTCEDTRHNASPSSQKYISMKIGFISMPLAGHLNPITALARKLQSRGHEIVFIGVPDAAPPV
jgi:hypothetical protein